ncbi:helix-turn-helix transcriptional regulator [Paenibacillus glycanilyticus]|uniref:AraC family transcriptional regulator n=1 Tax=Paenibacillus glycanilyticus TaxID=126569 RepID=A0ABQ6GM22_9BACL|nr:AraC family transcriptional regulator [Paenibacillus glycanilyticus]GLX70413.1 AraC family transcriptional regulator [Paenibacillus glycanilyticus]
MNLLDFLFYSKREKSRYIPPHSHECYELVYYFGGSGETRIGSKFYTFGGDMLAVIAPRTEHDERHDSEGDVLFIGFHSDQDILGHINTIIKDQENSGIKPLILRMNEEFSGKKQGYSEMLNLMIGELVILISRLTESRKSEQLQDNPLQYVRNYMEEHFRQKITVEELAVMSGYSYDRFRHLFKEEYGVPPLQYLFNKRMNYAKLMLYETNDQISQIAHSCGFSSEVQFCSMFKRETGMTAKAFRQRNRK